MLKFFCFVGGLLALAAVGHVNIMAGPGGYDGDHAPVIMAIIICSALAALAIGRTASDGQRLLAVGMFLCVAAAELYSFTTNAERYINARDIIQRASLGAGNSQKDAEKLVAEALARKTKADAALLDKASDSDCKAPCRQILKDAATAANADLKEARKSAPPVQLLASGTALADRLKIEPWKLDLFVAGLASLAANGLGFCLIAFAGHRKPKPASPANPAPAPIHLVSAPAPARPVPQAAITAAQRPRIATNAKNALTHAPAKPQPDEHGRLFFAAAMRKRAAARTDLEAVETAYRAWCHRIGCTPLPADEIGNQLIAQCMRLGIEGEDINGHLSLVGVELAKAA